MKRIKNWMMRLSIRKKLIVYSYLILTPILLLISTLLFFKNYHAAIQTENNDCLLSVSNLSTNINVMQENIIEMGTYICINNDITKILKTDDPSYYNQDAQLWLHNAPMNIIQDMIAINGQIKTLALYPENGVNPYLRCMDFSSYERDIETVHQQAIYLQAVENKGKMLWQRVGKNPEDTYQYNRSDKIVMYLEIYDLAKRDKLGYLVIGSSAEKFDAACKNALRNDRESVIIVSETGSRLCSFGTIEEEIVQKIIEEKSELTAGKELLISSSYDKYNVYQSRNKRTGITVYKIVPKIGIKDVLNSAIYMPLTLLLGFLIGLFPIMTLLSNLVSKPLQALGAAMENFKRGDFSQKVEVETLDEVGEACACFNSMVDDIKELIDKNYVMALRERESELDALQAQINPHFLYNALDSLYWRAIEAGDEEISEDILALSQLFRLVLNRGNSIVTVRNEVELLERYLHIQQMRFGKCLEYKIFINETIMEEKIPKLILQPFVENAIVHGFEKGGENYYLSIIGEKDNNRMVFYIRDTGVGMSEEQVAKIWESEDSREYASQRIGRYAIKNVKERLELAYHNEFELKIESKIGHGTTVKMVIPCEQKEREADEQKVINRG
ncbi:MAG: sensor histidine kinase [Lachnospiraceae bacterium]